MLSPDLPDMRGCPVMPMGAIPRLFMAVAQAFGSDMGIPNELESIAILRRPSKTDKKREEVGFKIRLNIKVLDIIFSFGKATRCFIIRMILVFHV